MATFLWKGLMESPDESDRYELEERAAIKEYDGNMTKMDAEQKAAVDVKRMREVVKK